jgi:protein-L-isoaspartate(D-aspartate) O-methyltransferase
MDFRTERIKMVSLNTIHGILHSEALIEAMLKIPREKFVPQKHVLDSYKEKHFKIPGNGWQTISSPSTYPLFYEHLEITPGDKILEIGTGSGYGAAIARELVGKKGKVITIEINKETYYFAKKNLKRAGYNNIEIIFGDGTEGYEKEAPYNKICITAACPEIPQPLINQLNTPGKLVAPIGPPKYILGQELILLEKINSKIRRKVLSKVLHAPLIGKFGWKKLPELIKKEGNSQF